MKAIFLVIMLFLVNISSVFAETAFPDPDGGGPILDRGVFPDGSLLEFHSITQNNTGYCSGTTFTNDPLQSTEMDIPEQIFNHGFTVIRNLGWFMDGMIYCYYHMQDNVTGETTPTFELNTMNQH